ncbi:MAG: SGNH/GDSL hydrolase family protein [Planctomycetes bacterium]|nr:SGNH/GDSL hydrolase family protein [Planctomycetota bacterium]
MTKKRSRLLFGLVGAAIAVIAGLLLVELGLRLLWKPPQPLGRLSYATADGEPVADVVAAAARGYVVPVAADQRPRERYMFAPGKSFYLCYSDNDQLHNDWFDDRGRVLVRIDDLGLRERPEVVGAKPPGQQRIVCIGDSFTFGWGVPEELCWVRLLEDDLRAAQRDVRTVNCGAAGALCVDEYEWGLRHRFGKLQPDAVIVTICLNDLIPSSGLFIQGPTPRTGLLTLDLLLRAVGRSPLDLDPKIDWVQLLLDLPEKAGTDSGLYGSDKPYGAMWSQGTPQRSLIAMKAWCDERNVPLMIVLWPFLQGLGPGADYPFARLHQMVGKFCSDNGLPFLDVLPALAGHIPEELWVTPADMHANPTAQRLATTLIAPFVAAHLPR